MANTKGSSANSSVNSSVTNGDDLDQLATFLDSKFKGPFGVRIGWDGIIGLIPGLGDGVTTLLSFYILIGAGGRGVSPSILVRMGLNIFIDKLIGAVPFIGWIGDFAWKSNQMNLELVKRYQTDPGVTRKSSRFVVFGVLAAIFIVIIGTVILAVWLATLLWKFIMGQYNGGGWV